MKTTHCYLQDFGYERFEQVVGMIGGKWKLRIIYMLAFHEVLRYGQLKRLLSPITHKMLTAQLKELERDGLIHRKAYDQVPPKVEYSMTEMGRDLRPLVAEMHKWISKYNIGQE
jgi:DNA-binding HxlR family transcriptional regulator